MTVKDCVKTMLSKRGWSQRKLAEELGYSGQGSIGKTLLTLLLPQDITTLRCRLR